MKRWRDSVHHAVRITASPYHALRQLRGARHRCSGSGSHHHTRHVMTYIASSTRNRDITASRVSRTADPLGSELRTQGAQQVVGLLAGAQPSGIPIEDRAGALGTRERLAALAEAGLDH